MANIRLFRQSIQVFPRKTHHFCCATLGLYSQGALYTTLPSVSVDLPLRSLILSKMLTLLFTISQQLKSFCDSSDVNFSGKSGFSSSTLSLCMHTNMGFSSGVVMVSYAGSFLDFSRIRPTIQKSKRFYILQALVLIETYRLSF
jgi:hypothetical protein